MQDFSIGDIVLVSANMVFKSTGTINEGIREALRFKMITKRTGIVTGRTVRYTGTIKNILPHSLEDWSEHCLEVKASHILWCVRFGWRNKEVLVADEDLCLHSHPSVKEMAHNIGRVLPIEDRFCFIRTKFPEVATYKDA